jgi:hypothetical protein
LCDDIHDAADVETRIRFAAKTSLVVQRVTTEQIKIVTQQVERHLAEARTAEVDLPELKEAQARNEAALNRALADRNQVTRLLNSPPTVGRVQIIKVDPGDEEKVEKALHRAQSEIRKRTRNAWSRWLEKAPISSDSQRARNRNIDLKVNKIFRAVFTDVEADLYHIKKRLFRSDKSDPRPRAAYRKLPDAADKAVAEINSLLIKTSKEVCTAAAREQDARVTAATRGQSDAERVVAQREQTIRDAKRLCTELRAQEEEIHERSASSLAVAADFDNVMREALGDERRRLLLALSESNDENRYWLSVQLLSTLRTADRLGIPQ